MRPTDLPPLSEEVEALLDVARQRPGPAPETAGAMLHRLKSAVGLPLLPGDGGGSPVDPSGGASSVSSGSAGTAGSTGVAASAPAAVVPLKSAAIILSAVGIAVVATTVVVSRTPDAPSTRVQSVQTAAPLVVEASEPNEAAREETRPTTTSVKAHKPATSVSSAATKQRGVQKRVRTSSRRRSVRRRRNIRRHSKKRAVPRATRRASRPTKESAATKVDPSDDRPVDQPPAQKPARAKKRADTSILKAERTLIETARIALRKGNISQALGLVAQHRLIYADGQLAEERDLISIRARVAAGRIKQARAESKRFFRRYPTSLLRPAVEAALRKRGK